MEKPKMLTPIVNREETFSAKSTQSEPVKYTALSRQDFNVSILKNWAEIKIGKLPQRRTEQISFQYENYFYIHGGRDINQGKKGDLCRVDITALIDGKSTAWENIKTSGDSPGNISNHRGCLVNNSLYVFGGVNSAEDSNSNIYILNVDILSWEKIQFSDKDVQPVSSHSMSLVNNSKLVIFGGVYRGKLYNKISIFDIDNNTWTIYPNDSSESVLPDERIEQSQITYGSKVYIYGGQGKEGKYFNDMWTFDINDMKWSQIEIKGEVPKARKGHSVVVYEDSFFIFGGKTGNFNEINQFWKYDIAHNHFLLLHDTMLDRYIDDETKSIFSAVPQKPKEQSTIKQFYNQNAMNRTVKSKRGISGDISKMSKTTNNTPFRPALKPTKNPYEDALLRSPKAKTMKFSLIYRMEHDDQLFLKQLNNIERTKKSETVRYGVIPAPRDGHSAFVFNDRMFIFGGDRNKFPFNDMFMFQFK